MGQVTEIRLNKQKDELKITFEDEMYYFLPAELQRVESPSAEVQDHSSNQKITPAGKSKIKILSIEPIGNYAIAIKFDDGHDTGIFSWQYLKKLSTDKETLWKNYLSRIKSLKLSRQLVFSDNIYKFSFDRVQVF